MNSKSRFQLSIAGLTIVLTGALTGAFISGMYLFLEEVDALRVLIMMLCLGLGISIFLCMIRLNRSEIENRVDNAVNDYHEFIDKWTIGPEQWRQFLRQRLEYEKGESNGYGYAVGGVFTFVIAVIGFSVWDLKVLIPTVFGSFVFFFLLGKWGSIMGAKRRFMRESAFSTGEVHFAEKLVVLNGELIMIEDFGTRLISFEIECRFGMDVILFKVERGHGSRRSFASFLIPLPEGKEKNGQRLIHHYSGLMSQI